MGVYSCAIEKDCFVSMRWSGESKKQFISMSTHAKRLNPPSMASIGEWGPTVLLSEDEALLMAENIIQMIKKKREAVQ
jgi:hypothetical protein